MKTLALSVALLAVVPACLSSDRTVSGKLPSSSFSCTSVQLHAQDAAGMVLVDQSEACGFTFGSDYTFSFAVPDGTRQLRVTFDQIGDDQDDAREVVQTIPGPIHADIDLGDVFAGS